MSFRQPRCPIRTVFIQQAIQSSALEGEKTAHMFDGTYLEVLFVIAAVLLFSPLIPTVAPQ
jgi:hypothetical protein